MSTWGSSTKISKLKQVREFSFFRSKSSLFKLTLKGKRYFGGNSRCTLVYLFLPSVSSESPTRTSARSARVISLIARVQWIMIKNFSLFSLLQERIIREKSFMKFDFCYWRHKQITWLHKSFICEALHYKIIVAILDWKSPT